MVQILIRSKDAHSEWGLVEFQGVLESKDDVNFNGSYTGDLHFDEKGTPYLIIGHHLLTGKIVDLNKPFAVMKKSTEHKQDQIEIDSMNIDDDYDDCKCKKAVNHYDIVALIRRKIIFKNRPRPIITNTNIQKR